MGEKRGRAGSPRPRDELLVALRSLLRSSESASAEGARTGSAEHDVGLLVIRVWRERDLLRARLSRIDADADDAEVISWVSSADEVLAEVETWLADFTRRGR